MSIQTHHFFLMSLRCFRLLLSLRLDLPSVAVCLNSARPPNCEQAFVQSIYADIYPMPSDVHYSLNTRCLDLGFGLFSTADLDLDTRRTALLFLCVLQAIWQSSGSAK